MSQALLKATVECVIWAVPAPDVSLGRLASIMQRVGNRVLEVDHAGNRLKVAHYREDVRQA